MQQQILMNGELAVERKRLRHVAHAGSGLHVAWVDFLAEEPRAAFSRGKQARQHLHRGGLAAAVGAEEAEYLPAPNAKTHMVHCDEVAEAHGEALGFNGEVVVAAVFKRWDDHGFVVMLAFFGQHGHEGGLQRVGLAAFQQFLRTTRSQDAAIVHGHQPIEALCFVHVGRGD